MACPTKLGSVGVKDCQNPGLIVNMSRTALPVHPKVRAAIDAGDLAHALAMLKRVMARSPLNRPSLFLLGEVFWRLRQFDRAEIAMRWVVVLDPGDPPGAANHQTLSILMRRWGAAALHWRRYGVVAAKEPDTLVQMYLKYDFDDMQMCARASLCLSPADVNVMVQLARAEAKLGGPKRAERRIAQARLLIGIAHPNVAGQILVAYGRNLMMQERHEPALESLRRGGLLAPGIHGLDFDLGRAFFELGEDGPAKRLLHQALVREPQGRPMTPFETKVLQVRAATEIESSPGYSCRSLDVGFNVVIDPKGDPSDRFSYVVPGTFLARADDAIHIGRDHCVILSDGSVLSDGLTYRQPTRAWDGPVFPYVSRDRRVLAATGPKTRTLEGEHILFGGGPNYYHCVVDWLSRLPVILVEPELRALRILVDQTVPDSIIRILELCGVSRERLVLTQEGLHPVERLWIPSLAHGRRGHVSPKYLKFLENHLFRPYRDPRKVGSRRLYFPRDGHRQIANATEVECLLERFGFQTVQLMDLPVEEQFGLASEAEIIVAPFGAGLTNILAAPESATVVELTHSHAVRALFPILSGLRGQPFRRVIGRHQGGRGSLPMHADFTVPVESLETKLRASLD